MTRMLAAVAGAVVLGGCSPQPTSVVHPQPQTLSRTDAEQLVLRADDLRRRAFELAATTILSDAFGAIALSRLIAQSQGLRLRGMREEERSSLRELVFWDPVSDEAVLEVVAQSRLVTADEPNPRWSATVRQWWVRLEDVGARWLVVDEQDLPPDRWRQTQNTG